MNRPSHCRGLRRSCASFWSFWVSWHRAAVSCCCQLAHRCCWCWCWCDTWHQQPGHNTGRGMRCRVCRWHCGPSLDRRGGMPAAAAADVAAADACLGHRIGACWSSSWGWSSSQSGHQRGSRHQCQRDRCVACQQRPWRRLPSRSRLKPKLRLMQKRRCCCCYCCCCCH